MSLLSVKNLEKTYKERKVVNALCFEVEEGEIVGLLGPNGAGKTTAFYMTMGLIRPDKGEIFFKEREITHTPIDIRARLGMSYLAQEPSIFRNLTVAENIFCILETLPLTKSAQRERLDYLLQEFHLEKLASHTAASLSGGERRRLEISRALVRDPSLLLLDEPFANIDPLSIYELKQLIRRLVEKKRVSILITDHNAREMLSSVDRSYLICEGRVIFSGSRETFIHDAEVRARYLGTDFKM